MSNAKLYVGNLSWGINDDQLRSHFAQIGEVVDAVVIKDRHSGRSKGFGFVEYANEADAQTAIEQFHETELDGRNLIVNIARPPRPREDRPRY